MEYLENIRKILDVKADSRSETDLQNAEDRVRQYVALAWRVYTRLETDPEAMARFLALTAKTRGPTINEKGRPTNTLDTI